MPSVGRKAQKSAQKAPWAGRKRHPTAKFGNHLAEKRRTPQQGAESRSGAQKGAKPTRLVQFTQFNAERSECLKVLKPEGSS